MNAYGWVVVQIHILLTLALVGGEWSASSPRGKSPRYPLDRRLSGPQGRSGWRGENSWHYQDSNSDLLVVQPVASLYTDYAILGEKIQNTQLGNI
jgi:hypothetical protein